MTTVTTPPASSADVSALPKPLTNLQLELLKIFSRQLPEEDLLEIRRMLVQFFSQRLSDAADKVWEEKGWTEETMHEMLNTKMRKRS